MFKPRIAVVVVLALVVMMSCYLSFAFAGVTVEDMDGNDASLPQEEQDAIIGALGSAIDDDSVPEDQLIKPDDWQVGDKQASGAINQSSPYDENGNFTGAHIMMTTVVNEGIKLDGRDDTVWLDPENPEDARALDDLHERKTDSNFSTVKITGSNSDPEYNIIKADREQPNDIIKLDQNNPEDKVAIDHYWPSDSEK